MAGNYDINDTVRCRAKFKNSNKVLIDPTSVTFKFKSPDGVITTYVYGVDSQLVRESTGIYYCDIDLLQSGNYIYRFNSSGTLKSGSESRFSVKRSEI